MKESKNSSYKELYADKAKTETKITQETPTFFEKKSTKNTSKISSLHEGEIVKSKLIVSDNKYPNNSHVNDNVDNVYIQEGGEVSSRQVNVHSANYGNASDGEWRKIVKKRSTRNSLSFSGTKQDSLPTVAKENTRWLFVSRLDKSVTEDNVLNFLKAEVDADYKVQKLTPKMENANYASFKIGVPGAIYSQVMKPEFWPQNAFINKFYYSNKQNFHITTLVKANT